MMPANATEPNHRPTPVTGFFEGERLELTWRYAYRPEFVPLLMDYLGAQPGMRILDAGCGTGFLARLLARTLSDPSIDSGRRVQVVGLDADRKMLDLARQMLEREGLTDRVELQQGNAYQIPFPDGTFDLVTSHTLL